ncbi:MAG: KilA-N domain-containing protein [Bacteroidales bacterium]|nr:KilA-N domain-containing protein [Bacteroidales bacterium]
MAKIIVQDTEIAVTNINGEDYICITDMLKAKDGDFFVTDWLRNRNTMEFLGVWERIYNPNFNYGEFATIRNQSGLNNFKINYRIHTDAIKSNLIPAEVTREQAAMKYAEEADVLNVAMFGMTAKQWREANPDLKGNIRDYATINELICLSNMENINAVLINDGMPQGERLVKLNQIAIQQMQVLEDNESRRLLK